MPAVETRPAGIQPLASQEVIFSAPTLDLLPLNPANREIALVQNETLLNVVSLLETTPIDWGRVLVEADPSGQLRADPRQASENFQGRLFEAHLRLFLQDFAKSNTGIVSPFFKETQRANEYVFIPRHNGMGVWVNHEQIDGNGKAHVNAVTDVDVISSIGGTLTGFEAKAVAKVSNGNGKGISPVFAPEYANRKFQPFVELYGISEFAFVVVTTKNRVTNSEPQRLFKKRGGIIVGIPETYDEFIENMRRYKNQTVTLKAA